MISQSAAADNVSRAMTQNPQASRLIAALAQKSAAAWLVGGAARDAILGRPITDLDLAVAGDPAPLADSLGRELDYSIFPLDARRGFYRLTARAPGSYSADICRLRGDSIRRDLAGRDFTVNAIAVELGAAFTLLDPFGGVEDLQKSILRPVSGSSLPDDPLRILRAYRLMLTLGLEPAPGLLDAIREAAPSLNRVAGERIMAELAKIFRHRASGPAICGMARDGTLEALFPEAGLGGESASARLGTIYDKLDPILEEAEPADYLARPVGSGISRKETIKLAALFAHCGGGMEDRKGIAARAMRRLKAPLAAARGAGLLAWGWSAYRERWDESGLFEWLSAMGDWAEGALLLARAAAVVAERAEADSFATSAGRMKDRWEKVWPKSAPPVTGRDLMEKLGLPAGPRVGELLRRAEKAAVLGKMTSPPEIWDFIKKSAGRSEED